MWYILIIPHSVRSNSYVSTASSLPFPSSTSVFHVIAVTPFCHYLLAMDGALIDLMHKTNYEGLHRCRPNVD